jgi:hypothetical protein
LKGNLGCDSLEKLWSFEWMKNYASGKLGEQWVL